MPRQPLAASVGRLRERLAGRPPKEALAEDLHAAVAALERRVGARQDAAAAESRSIGDAVAGLAARLDALEAAMAPVGPTAAGLAERLDALEAAAGQPGVAGPGQAARLDAAETAIGQIGAAGVGLAERIDALEGAPTYAAALRGMALRIDALETVTAVEAVSRWVAQAALRESPLISVVTPTQNRPDDLRRAIASVRAQTYDRWEMVVVDDGGDTDSAAVATEPGDPRIRHARIEAAGCCAARNHALGIATGSLVAYLDDDNVMDPGWLRAVAWVFVQRPDVDVIYGAMLIDDMERAAGTGSGALPHLYLRPYDRMALLGDNLTDIGAIAHRAGLPQARFDEQLEACGDWDLLIRLTTRKPPLPVPAISCYYSTAAGNRLSSDTAAVARCRTTVLAAHAVERRLGRHG